MTLDEARAGVGGPAVLVDPRGRPVCVVTVLWLERRTLPTIAAEMVVVRPPQGGEWSAYPEELRPVGAR